MHSGDLDTLNRKTHAGSRMGERSKSGSARTGQATVLVTHEAAPLKRESTEKARRRQSRP